MHNIAYQGRFAFADFDRLGLTDDFRGSFDFIDGYNFCSPPASGIIMRSLIIHGSLVYTKVLSQALLKQ